jgi:hypothetical protein
VLEAEAQEEAQQQRAAKQKAGEQKRVTTADLEQVRSVCPIRSFVPRSSSRLDQLNGFSGWAVGIVASC